MQTQKKQPNTNRVRRLVLAAVLCGMAYAVQLLFRFHVAFLTFDAKDAVLTLGGILLGPGMGLGMSVALALMEMVTVSSTGFWGFLMNAVASSVFVCLVSIVYRRRHTMQAAVLGLLSGVFGMTVAMLGLNVIVTPIYAGTTAGEVVKMIPTLLLPFNLIKGLFNAALVLILFKPISVALKRSHILPAEESEPFRWNRTSVVTLVSGLSVLILCAVAIILWLNGSISFGIGG